MVSPLVRTLDDQVQDWSGLIQARPIELQLMLFKTYLELTAQRRKKGEHFSNAMEPDRFLYWCELIISDFSDTDLAMTQASHLFRNLKDIKELQTLPLDEEQLELIRQFWDTTGVPWLNPDKDADRMWVYEQPEGKKEGIRNFLKLWEILGPLYNRFRESLVSKGFGYKGMLYRTAAETLKAAFENDYALEKQKYIFIGFSFLSNAEKSIMQTLAKWGKADFYWDTYFPNIGMTSKFAMKFVEHYASVFPSPVNFELQPNVTIPEIKLYGVPSNIAQAKKAAEIINNDACLTKDNALGYAVVLPESNLCMPFLNALDLPGEIGCNLSMGFPVKDTPMASLMNVIVQLKSTAVFSRGMWKINRNCVLEVVSQPLLLSACPEECNAIHTVLRGNRGTFIPAAKFLEKTDRLSFLFAGFEQENIDKALEQFILNINNLIELLIPVNETDAKVEPEETHDITREFLLYYQAEANRLLRLLREFGLQQYLASANDSVFVTLEKIIRRLSFSFVGTPLKGIQVMGVTETFALDFNKIIITSLNENIFPGKLQKKSFIPQSLRAAYGLDTTNDEETLMAYHFYRLLSQVSDISLIYNSDIDSLKSGEFSRYIYQLKYLSQGVKISEKDVRFRTWTPKPVKISVDKDNLVMSQLEHYFPHAGGKKKFLSASSIKKYLNCPLQFYLSVVCGFSDEDQDLTHINDSNYGTIAHRIMENLYKRCPVVTWRGSEYHKVTPYDIGQLLEQNVVAEIADEAIKEFYYGKGSSDKELVIEGEALIFRDMAIDSVIEMLHAERRYMQQHSMSHFLFIEAEAQRDITLNLPGVPPFNFRYIIDRVDRIFPVEDKENGFLRIIDYKTGGDKLIFSDVESLVNYNKKNSQSHPMAIMQLLLYSLAYAADTKNGLKPHEKIQPMIYSFREVSNDGEIRHITQGTSQKNESVEDYNDLRDQFLEHISPEINNIFDPTKPFLQTENPHNCTYCRFKEICRR